MTVADPKERAARISYRQCRLFESVGRLASVRQGSEECNLSQPAVTQALSKLEEQVGECLLERQASGSYLTESGKLFNVRVQRMFAQMESALLALCGDNAASAAALANRLSRSQVRGLVAIIEHGSLALAAESLDLTEASLQRAIRQLEGNLRRAVCSRTSSGIVLTPEGVELGRRLKLANLEIELGIREIDEARGAQDSQLVLGTLPYGGSMLLASVLDEFLRRHPQTKIRILTEGASEMRRRLKFGDVDFVIGILQENTDADLVDESLAGTQFRVVARSGHPLVGRNDLTLEDLASCDWIVGLKGASRRLCFEALFQGRKPPRAVIETSTLPIIRHIVRGSDRLTLMTSYELRHEANLIVQLPFGPLPVNPAVGITMRADWLPTRTHRVFIDLMKQALSDQTKGPEPVVRRVARQESYNPS
jgi:LysR family transcriptional regulator of gallate degradation